MNVRAHVFRALRMMSELNGVIRDTHGNVSQRDGTNVFIKPSGIPYQNIEHSDVCRVTFEHPRGIRNKRMPSVDALHHVKIYENCPWINAICHTHSPYAVAFAVLGLDILCNTTEQSDYFGASIECLPYSGLENWGERAAFRLEKSTKSVLLQNHGVLTFAETAEEAVKLASALENVAMKNYLTETLGVRKQRMSVDEIEKWHSRYKNEYGQRKDPDSE